MNCWMFPGQPVDFSGLPENGPEFRKIALLCQQTTGFNPIEYNISAPGLVESVRLQLFGACISLFRCNQLTALGGAPDLIAEHSMGIYPALAASGSINAATALELTWRIGVAMAEKFAEREYALGCVIGLTRRPLAAIAANNGVYIANHNTSRHFLLAGEREKMVAALLEAKSSGAFSVRNFHCDAPLHTPLIGEIAGELRRIVAGYTFHKPRIPLVEHISQMILTAPGIPLFLVSELCCPVFWETTYRDLGCRGVKHFQAVGAGLALSKFNRWIDSES